MTALRILVTGSRNWTDRATIVEALTDALGKFGAAYPDATLITLVHGGALGVDSIANSIWRGWQSVCALADPQDRLLADPEVHPADWATYGRSAGHRRNAEMVKLGANVCLAFPLGESRGTRGCMRLAERAGIPVVVHEGATT